MRFAVPITLYALLIAPVAAFAPHGTTVQQQSPFSLAAYTERGEPQDSVRRNVITRFPVASALIFEALQGWNPETANASGGATAGGAYLLSAKQRYNQRVKAGVKSFVGLKGGIEAGDLGPAKAFFESEDIGNWKDASAAGYLLANAFRRNSTTPPDSLPAVKKWKAFAAELDNLQKSLKKKDVKGVKVSYDKALTLLDAYLEVVELPSILELD